MKKFDLLKVLGITLLVVALISWIIPIGGYSNGAFSSLETTAPVGLFDLFRLPVITIVTFIQYGLLFLTIGGFYGVLNNTGVYSKVVEKIVSKYEKSKSKFLVITVLLFILLTSIVGTPSFIFILVPFFTTILLKLGYNKITSFASTIGSMLIGQIGTTFGFTIWGYLMNIFGLKMTELLFVRIVFMVILVVLFIIFVKKHSNNEKNKLKKSKKKDSINEEIKIPLYVEQSSKKNTTPLIIICILTFIFLILGVYNWYYALEIDFFMSLYNSMMEFEIMGYPIFANLLGGMSQLGFFSNYDIIVILLIVSLIIGWVYSLKLNDIIESFKNGCKEMLRPALYSMLACVIFTALLNISNNYSGNYDFIYTIINKFISGSEQFSLTGTIGSGLVAGFSYNDFYTMLSNMSGIFGVYDSNVIPVIAFIFQTMYSLVMVIAPTSIFLLAGLSYLDIPYKQWIKYIWKFLLIIFGIVVVISFILTTLI